MATIDDFMVRYSSDQRPIANILKGWEKKRLAKDIADAVIVSGVMAADLLNGDGFRDHVPQAVRDAVGNLARQPNNLAMYDTVRERIEALETDSIDGWVNKYKGQIGEDLFAKTFGAQLATSGSQEGYDLVRQTQNGPQYIQVKMYSDPNGVVENMVEVQHKLTNGQIYSHDTSSLVSKIDWAVPEDIADEVKALSKAFPELAGVTVYSVPMTALEAEGICRAGVASVQAEGLERLNDLFGEVTTGVATAVSMQVAFVGFLWWKGQVEAERAHQQLTGAVFTSTAGFTAAIAAEEIADSLLLGGPVGFAVGFTARQVVLRALRSRTDFVSHNASANVRLKDLVRKFSTC